MTLHIREYSHMAGAGFAGGAVAVAIQAPVEPALAVQRLEAGELSKPFAAATKFVQLTSDMDYDIDIGATPDAVKRGSLLPAGTAFFGVQENHRVAVEEAGS